LNAQGKDDIRYFLCCFVRKELLSFWENISQL
jgi:hypothetical protein